MCKILLFLLVNLKTVVGGHNVVVLKPAVLICASKPLFGQLYELDQVDQNIDPCSS